MKTSTELRTNAVSPQATAADRTEPAGESHAFDGLGLAPEILSGLIKKGYTQPSEIQAQAIPVLLGGKDLVGQAQTGTGKTAAFGLPLLQRIVPQDRVVQALVLAPTRELAMQVSAALEGYASGKAGIRTLTVYGGAPIYKQLQSLSRGVHIVVGTPGRVMDCIKRGALQLGSVHTVVLDEADEMLRMGFIEDVEWILEHTPRERQTALFSATMPDEIRRIAQSHLREPVHISVHSKTRTVAKIDERYLVVPHRQKFEALTRVLEAEVSEAVLIFARTRANCNDLSEQLREHGFATSTLHGDVSQGQREEVVRSMKSGRVKIVVATDVAARGLDVDSITHVINYDMPAGPDIYVHRIGRTGRAGREGVSLILLTPRERRGLQGIERFTGQAMRAMPVPKNADITQRRSAALKARIVQELGSEDLEPYRTIVRELLDEGECSAGPVELAAALARIAAGDKPVTFAGEDIDAGDFGPRDDRRSREAGSARDGGQSRDGGHSRDAGREMLRLFLPVGHRQGMRPGLLVAAIASGAEIPGKAIGAIDIRDDATFFTLDARYSDQVVKQLGRISIRGRSAPIRLARLERASPRPFRPRFPRHPAPRVATRSPKGARSW